MRWWKNFLQCLGVRKKRRQEKAKKDEKESNVRRIQKATPGGEKRQEKSHSTEERVEIHKRHFTVKSMTKPINPLLDITGKAHTDVNEYEFIQVSMDAGNQEEKQEGRETFSSFPDSHTAVQEEWLLNPKNREQSGPTALKFVRQALSARYIDPSNRQNGGSVQSKPFLYTAEEGGVITIGRQKLGSGGFSIVRMATLTKEDQKRTMAVKVMRREMLERHPEFVTRELTILMSLVPRHPHIVEIHSIFQMKGTIYILMEYAEFGNVADFIEINGPMSETGEPGLCRRWFRQACEGLWFCHSCLGIAHRDVKCKNLLISSEMNIKLCDFGLSRFYDPSVHFLSHTFCGTVEFLPPEVLRHEPYDPTRSDVWSLGVCLFYMLHSDLPFSRSRLKRHCSDSGLLMRPHMGNGVSLAYFREGLSDELNVLFTGLWEVDPSKRMTLVEVLQHPWVSADKVQQQKE